MSSFPGDGDWFEEFKEEFEEEEEGEEEEKEEEEEEEEDSDEDELASKKEDDSFQAEYQNMKEYQDSVMGNNEALFPEGDQMHYDGEPIFPPYEYYHDYDDDETSDDELIEFYEGMGANGEPGQDHKQTEKEKSMFPQDTDDMKGSNKLLPGLYIYTDGDKGADQSVDPAIGSQTTGKEEHFMFPPGPGKEHEVYPVEPVEQSFSDELHLPDRVDDESPGSLNDEFKPPGYLPDEEQEQLLGQDQSHLDRQHLDAEGENGDSSEKSDSQQNIPGERVYPRPVEEDSPRISSPPTNRQQHGEFDISQPRNEHYNAEPKLPTEQNIEPMAEKMTKSVDAIESWNSTTCKTETDCRCPGQDMCKVSDFVSVWLTHDGIPGTIFLIGNMFSMLGLFLAFIVFCMFHTLRSGPRGIATMNYLLALFFAKMAFQVNPYFTSNQTVCSVMAIFQHYFCLAAFLWMNVLAYDIFMEAYHVHSGHIRDVLRRRGYRDLIMYACFAWGLPFSVIVACLTIEVLVGMQFLYGNQEQCGVFGDEALLYSLAIPLVIISLLNMLFFTCTVQMLHLSSAICSVPRLACDTPHQDRNTNENSSSTEPVSLNNPQRNALDITVHQATGRMYHEANFKEYLRPVWTYVRMAAITAMAWLSGFIAVFTQIYSLWFLFVIFNSLQGILIFVPLVFNQQVVKLILDRFHWIPERIAIKCGYMAREKSYEVSGPFPCSIPVISDGYSLLDSKSDMIFFKEETTQVDSQSNAVFFH